ncbi:MAG: 3'(2'),5'-bisphosphate nucleotidase CysQ [Parashewanella sp.]
MLVGTQQILTQTQLLELRDIAIKAGSAILPVYSSYKQNKQLIGIRIKQDNTPVTEADLLSHQVIETELRKQFPQWPILSEESNSIPWSERKKWHTYWLVDPLDGTKEFIAMNDEFTVNIALIHHGNPVAGVVYAPALSKCYFGAQGLNAWVQHDQSQDKLPISKKWQEVPRVLVSRSHPSVAMEAYLASIDKYQLMSIGSSLKFCLLAEGHAELYPRLGPTCEWDTAAGHAVLNAAGGRVELFEKKQSLRYNQTNSLLNPFFIAGSPYMILTQ